MNFDEIKHIKDNFVKELQTAESGTKTSLPFIKHTLSPVTLVQKEELFQTLVIGGSYYQKALMKRINGNIVIVNHSQGAQPPFLSQEDLLIFIEKHLAPEATVVALNFAYPMEPINRDGRLDGVLKMGSKENTFEGMIGKTVGETVEAYIKNKQHRDIKVSVANDTICLLLSGLIHHEWDTLSAGIVGTGLNFALFLDKHTIVNLEAAYFNQFTQSPAGHKIDQESASPGDALYEKEVSGAYLYQHFNYLAQKQGLDVEEIDSTKMIDVFANGDDETIATTARQILAHSAALVSAQVAGILEFSGRDLVFIMQGSLYWKGYKYKETVEKLVAELCPQYNASYENVLHSDLYGAAKLVG